jgi:hypothetical protein
VDAVVRVWLGFFALGAGLIHVALVIGSPPTIGIPLLLVGIAEFAWGVFAVTAAQTPVPRVARIAALVPILGWAVLLLAGSGTDLGVRVVPMLVASLLDLAIAIAISLRLRRSISAQSQPLRPGTYLLGLGLGALVVGALTAPALAATEAGESGQTPGTPVESPTDLPDGHPAH